MTIERRAGDVLPQILVDLAQGPYPDYVDDVLATTARKRQRPAWTFPERWVPMVDIARAPAIAPRVPWRAIQLAVLLIALLLAVVVALIVGTAPRLPSPFGVARNGLVAYESAGDIYTADPTTGKATAIVSGPGIDLGPRFSLDGASIVFERQLDGTRSQLYAARSDGRDVTLLTPEPITLAPSDAGRAWERYQFSPDGTSVLFSVVRDRIPTIAIARADGGGVRDLDVGMAATEPSFRPPDGAEILFVSSGPTGRGLFSVDPSTGAVRPIVKLTRGFNVAGASWSPDGSRIAYWTWSETASGLSARTHLVAADGTRKMEVPMPPGAVWNAHATWSNDGTRLFIARAHTPGFDDVRGVVVPADGSSVGVEVAAAGVETQCCAAWMWSPDDTKLLGRPSGSVGQPIQHVIVDVATRTVRRAAWASINGPTWQRLAP